MNDKENVIREKRTNLAIKNNLMGPSGKFGIILQAFGSPITRQGSGLFDTNYLNTNYEDPVYTEYGSTMSGQDGPVAYRDEILDNIDDFVVNEGLMFDGLSRGIHLDITYWHVTNEMKVFYRGYSVYREVAGELYAYAPFSDWEDPIERLYKAAKEKMKNMKKIEQAELQEAVTHKKQQFWHNLRMRWGV